MAVFERNQLTKRKKVDRNDYTRPSRLGWVPFFRSDVYKKCVHGAYITKGNNGVGSSFCRFIIYM